MMLLILKLPDHPAIHNIIAYNILTLFIPLLNASNATFSAAVWAANAVLLRVPLNPELPADAQVIVSPLKLVKNFLSVPPLFRDIPTDELHSVEMPSISLHNTNIERGVKLSAEAAKKAIGHEAQEALILVTEQKRNEFGTNPKKSDFLKKWSSSIN